jgi:hypothetical protein
MTNLKTAQTELLRAAAAASDGAIDRAGDPRAIASLIKKDFLIALPQDDGSGRLLITAAGRAAIGTVGEMATAAAGPHADKTDKGDPGRLDAEHVDGSNASDVGQAGGEAERPAADSSDVVAAKPLPKGKIGALVGLLRRPSGATVETMMQATGWQAHSVRGAMSGAIKKNLGLAIASDKTEDGRVYRIVSEAAA